MRILLFFLWLTLGLAYFLIWNQRNDCCTGGTQQVLSFPSLFTGSPSSDAPEVLSLPESLNTGQNDPVQANHLKIQSLDTVDITPGCILFKWGQSDPITRPCFNAWRDSIAGQLKEGQMLEMIGEYFDRENQVMASGNVGLLRALKTKKLFQGVMNETLLKIRSNSVPERDSVEHRLFQSLRVQVIFYNELIKEMDEKTLIYFAYGTEDQIHNQWLESYTDHLVAMLKNTRHELQLVGHTDDDATAESNQKLGLQRAELVKYLLVSKGLKASRIKTSSKGESSPIAPNDTEQNRSLNRRVELFILSPNQSK
ncbi:MAG: OmpA family protein [Saprospiraceae bacterium]|nr:OmpA family protein [Saprospiraceae bacterium]